MENYTSYQQTYIQTHSNHNNTFSFLKIKKSFIQKVQYHIQKNIDNENFNTAQLCKAIGLSRSQVHNKIKAATGLSTSIYIRSVRLNASIFLLKNSDYTISEIAYEVGFKNPSYFSKLFTDKFGITPSHYKKTKISNYHLFQY